MPRIYKRIFFTLMTIVLGLFLLEISCFITLKFFGLADKTRIDWLECYNSSGMYKTVDLNMYQKEQTEIYKNVSFDFYRYYRPKNNFKGRYMSTDKEGFRNTVQHLEGGKIKTKTIVFLGGSTMWGIGSPYDYATIPSLFSKYINGLDKETNYIVKNYGVGGYQNTQEMIVLLEKIGIEEIDFVIFFDWVNESAMGYREFLDGSNKGNLMQPSVSIGYEGMIKFLLNRGYFDEAVGFSIALRRMLEYSSLFKIFSKLKNNFANNGSLDVSERELEQAKRIIRLYRKNKEIIECLAKTFKFTPYFFMQPNILTKSKLSNFEKMSSCWKDAELINFRGRVYEFARREFSKDSNFYDITNCINEDETIYIDGSHVSIEGNRLIAKAILNKIGPEIIKISKE